MTDATVPPLTNPAFTGAAPALDMLLGAGDLLEPGQTYSVEITVELNPTAVGVPDPIENQATAQGTDPDGTNVMDDSDDGTDPEGDNGEGGNDDPTPFECEPANIQLATLTPTICEGEDVEINLTSDVTNATFEWVDISNPLAILSTNMNPTFTPSATTTYEVRVYPTDECHTDLTEQITIEIIDRPVSVDLINVDVCEGELLQLFTTIVADAYFWSGPNGFTSNAQNPFVTSNAALTDAGDYFLIVEENGCTSLPGRFVISVSPIPTPPTITSNGPICDGEDLILETSSTGFDTYQWIGPDGSSVTTLMNSALTTTTNSTTIPNTNTAYDAGSWTLNAISASGCEVMSNTIDVVINPIPDEPTPTNSGDVCLGENFTLTAGAGYAADALYCLLYTSPSPRDATLSRMPSSA